MQNDLTPWYRRESQQVNQLHTAACMYTRMHAHTHLAKCALPDDLDAREVRPLNLPLLTLAAARKDGALLHLHKQTSMQTQ